MAAESELEAACLAAVKRKMGRMPKWTSPGNVGVPDRVLLMPNKHPVFVEFKAPKGKLRPAQVRWIEWLQASAFEVWVIDDFDRFMWKLTQLLEN